MCVCAVKCDCKRKGMGPVNVMSCYFYWPVGTGIKSVLCVFSEIFGFQLTGNARGLQFMAFRKIARPFHTALQGNIAKERKKTIIFTFSMSFIQPVSISQKENNKKTLVPGSNQLFISGEVYYHCCLSTGIHYGCTNKYTCTGIWLIIKIFWEMIV